MTRRLGVGALTAGLVLILAGCVADVPEPAATPAASASPTPSTEPADAGPTPRVDATCDDLIDPAALQAFMGERVQPLEAVSAADRLSPDAAAIEQLGALTCRWTNGLPGDYGTGPDPESQTVEFTVLPEGLDAAVAYVDLYRSADATYGEHVQGPRCVIEIGYCELAGVIGATWLELRVYGIVVGDPSDQAGLLARFRTIADPMVASVATMAPRPRWEPDAPSAILGADCDALTPTDEIAALTGIADLRVGPQWDGPRIGQYWYATEQTGAMRCSLAITTGEFAVGQIGILPSGAWGFARYSDAWFADGGTAVRVDGVEEDDAIARCTDAASPCVVDLVVGGDWVRVLAYPVPAAEPEFGPSIADYESARAAVVDIAAIVAGRIAAS